MTGLIYNNVFAPFTTNERPTSNQWFWMCYPLCTQVRLYNISFLTPFFISLIIQRTCQIEISLTYPRPPFFKMMKMCVLLSNNGVKTTTRIVLAGFNSECGCILWTRLRAPKTYSRQCQTRLDRNSIRAEDDGIISGPITASNNFGGSTCRSLRIFRW